MWTTINIYVIVLLSKQNFNNDKKKTRKSIKKTLKDTNTKYLLKFKAFLRVIHQIKTKTNKQKKTTSKKEKKNMWMGHFGRNYEMRE